MIKVFPYHKKHLDLFEQRPEDVAFYGEMSSDHSPVIFDYGQCFTVVNDGRIVLIGGILEVSAHTGKCSTILSIYAQDCILELIKKLRDHTDAMMESMMLHRIETSSPKESEEQRKWCKLLGFKEEGEMPFYDDKGRTYVRLAKTTGACYGV
jgi:hypothetical protein